MLKTILIYGITLGLILLILNSIEYLFWVRFHFIEIYIGLVAIIFLGLGIWFGRKKQLKIESNNVTFAQPNYGQLGISKREYEVLKLVGKGFSNQEIADQLFVSNNTIKTHTSRLFEKLEVKNRTQAILKAKQIGMEIE
ncbi:MAG: response regulator transcription factor [Bacteroidota bacterium]